jgi:hypothetical protein
MLYGGRINSMVSTGHCADVMFRVRENYCWYGRRCPRMLADKTQPCAFYPDSIVNVKLSLNSFLPVNQ